MGWLFSPQYNERRDKKLFIEYLTRTQKTGGIKHECIAHCCRGNILWGVWQITNDIIGCSSRYICCHILSYAGRGDACWGVKDISEDMGPIYTSCPEKYFKMVSECFISKSKYAINWRNKVKKINRKEREKREFLKSNFHKAQETGSKCILNLIGSTIDRVEIISLSPLKGKCSGGIYKIPRKFIGDSYIEKTKIIGTDNPSLVGTYNG